MTIKLEHEPYEQETALIYEGYVLARFTPAEIVKLASLLDEHADWLLATETVSVGRGPVRSFCIVEDEVADALAFTGEIDDIPF